MLTTIQIVLLIFILFAISRVYLRAKEQLFSTKTAIFWYIIWIAGLIGVLLPKTTSKLAGLFGVGRGVDVIVYIALALLFYLVFRIYVMIEDIRHEITSLVREIALPRSQKRPSTLSSSRPPKTGPPFKKRRRSEK